MEPATRLPILQCPSCEGGAPVLPRDPPDPRIRASEYYRPHPEEPAKRGGSKDGRLPRPRLLSSFETAAQEGGLLRMRSEIQDTLQFFTRAFAEDDTDVCFRPSYIP